MTDDKPKDVLRATDAEAIRLDRRLLRTARHAALAVCEPGTGWPLASRVSVATDILGRPLILVSSLSAHTGGLEGDERCSLLFGEPGKGDPLAHPRMTVKCRAHRIGRDDADHVNVSRRFLGRHPKAKLYADFADFFYFLLEPVETSLNGGFGRAYHITRDELLSDATVAAELQAAEPGAVAHMNEDHLDAIALYASHFAGISETLDWTMTGLDPDGFDLAAGDRTARIFFPKALSSAADMRMALVAMAKEARAATA
ncbi:HugZ family pyridoxamine 5'-phosphate oxidase [Aliihoeflea sp. PC F10.4]